MTLLRIGALVGLVAALAGCSILNKPDRDAIVGDAGMDAPMPDGDAMVDGDTGDAGDACTTEIEDCDDGADNDCDGFVDCADSYCASRMVCCEGGTPEEEPWNNDEITANWSPLPDGAGMVQPNYDDVAGILTGFDNVQGIITKRCVPLATGYRLQTYFRMESPTCTGAAECYVSLVFTPAPTIGAGRRLPDDLAVNAYSDGRLTVTNGGRILGERRISMDNPVATFIVDITVGDDGGTPSLLGTVRLQTEAEPFVDAEPIAPLESLLDDGACTNVGGLNLAIEGAGRQFAIGPLRRAGVECINAGSFLEPDATTRGILAAIPMSLEWAEWASGGIGSPGIAYRAIGPTWYVVGDGTDADRALDGAAAELGYAVGFASVPEDNWNVGWEDTTISSPKLGSCFPSCLGTPSGSCTEMCTSLEDSFRDPSFEQLSIELGTGTVGTVVYAKRMDVDSYGIAVETGFSTSSTAVLPEATTIDPGSVVLDGGGPCMSLRDPMLVRRDRTDTTQGYWLFFSCFEALDRAEIHAVQLDAGLTPVMGSHQVVVRRSAEDWAASSVWSPEVIVEHEPDMLPDGGTGRNRDLYRLWFLARNRDSNIVSIGLVQAQLDPEQPDLTLPEFVPFGANPILSEGDAALRCGSSCRLRGFSVARVGTTPTLRFLIARQDDTNPTAPWHYVPFEQNWKSPWQ